MTLTPSTPTQAPRVTLLLTTYNHEPFVAEAVASCLAQDYPNMELFISDDGSEDDTWARVEAAVADYRGPHKITLNHNEHNLFLDHLPSVAGKLSGELIVMACDDDVQYPHRVSRLVELWRETDATVLASSARRISALAEPMGYHRLYEKTPEITLEGFLKTGDNPTCFGAAIAWHRRLTDTFNHLPVGSRNIDFLYPLRGLMLTGAAFCKEPLLDWRRHGGNMSLGFQIEDAQTDTARIQLQERHLLNLMANWHGAIGDAQRFATVTGDQATANRVANAAVQHIINVMNQWRPIRHRLALAKIGIY
ncbi:glycosyltransferase [Halochromatium glycolicum]|uniref:Glycosyltransferase 2-like domain-containing protein n=1 Tax=Halochromatium glycolicum TaxID=85075 RepID=A0AAJ0U1Y2_9GAMM|nr:glycosyltransferase [Halochromatium glycolicum]MBK1703362.1 hypothetical protein [Halochromatium glycolicum]